MRQRPAPGGEWAQRLARWGLPDAPEFPLEPFGDAEFNILYGDCERNRLLGLLAAAIDVGDIAVTEEQLAWTVPLIREWQAVQLRHEHLLLRAATVLDEAGIDFRVLKGVALSRVAYPQPEWRTFGDVDVLVPSHEFGRAARVLSAGLPARRALEEPAPGFDDAYGREILLHAGELEFDLHRTFISGYYGLVVPTAELFARRDTIVLAGREIPVLAPAHRILHAAIATSIGDMQPRLIAARDLVQMARALGDDAAAIDDLLATARGWRCESLLAAAVLRIADWLPAGDGAPLVQWAGDHRPGPGSRLVQAMYHSAYRGPLVSLSGVLAPLGVRGRWRYLTGITRQTWVSWRSRRAPGRAAQGAATAQ